MTGKEIDKLVANLDKRAKPPRSIGFWPESMVIYWLKSHQKKENQNACNTEVHRKKVNPQGVRSLRTTGGN